MKILSCLLLGFNWQQRLQLAPINTELQLASNTVGVAELERNDKILKVLSTAGAVGQVGSLASEEDQLKMEEVAKNAFPFSESNPARIPLTGEHKLVYSTAPGIPSGHVFGNVVGKVTQLFEDDEIFYNRVTFGPLQISLRAKRQIMNDLTIKVSFLEMSFNLFGRTLLKKSKAGGGGGK